MRCANIISEKVFIRIAVVVFAILFFQLPTWVVAEDYTVMTRNLYVGADITALGVAPDLPTFIAGVQLALDQAADNDFTERAVALAAEIVDKNPRLVGLQEVYILTSSITELNGSPPFLNYLDELLEELSAQGVCYYEAATVTNLDLSGPLAIPTPLYGFVSATDRDVILARCDVDTQPVDLQSLCKRPSMVSTDDGCTYQVTASTVIPGGGLFPDITIDFKRGYVAVDVIGSFPFRYFNTHLEVRNPDPNNPSSPLVQRLQAMELIDFLSLPKPHDGPVIVVGDINSSPEDTGTILGLKPPYMQLEDALLLDVWKLRPGKPKGYTCCYDEDLSIPADLYERIDVIFSSVEPSRVRANVVGNDEADKTPSKLWPSDHAGVTARMEFAP